MPSEDDFSGDNEEAYFADEDGSTSRVNTPRPTDDRGYVIRQNLSDIGTKADYVIPLGTVDGVWSMMKQVGRWKPEGWLSLWKGLDISSSNLTYMSLNTFVRSRRQCRAEFTRIINAANHSIVPCFLVRLSSPTTQRSVLFTSTKHFHPGGFPLIHPIPSQSP